MEHSDLGPQLTEEIAVDVQRIRVDMLRHGHCRRPGVVDEFEQGGAGFGRNRRRKPPPMAGQELLVPVAQKGDQIRRQSLQPAGSSWCEGASSPSAGLPQRAPVYLT